MRYDDHSGGPGASGDFDAILPQDMARRAEQIGYEKAGQHVFSLLALAIMAGGYVAFGATFAATVTVGLDSAVGPGLAVMIGGVAFSLAYVLAIVGGAELFTTNNMMVMAWAHGRLATSGLLRAWGIVFVGNLAGTVFTALLLVLAGQHNGMDFRVGLALLESARGLQSLGIMELFFLGVLGNTLLCLGVWLTYSARSTTDRILALTPPVVAFYALGLEHAIAVMFYIPCAAMISFFAGPEFQAALGETVGGVSLSGTDLWAVLLPVTVGNIIGGGGLVALVYWFVYLRPRAG